MGTMLRAPVESSLQLSDQGVITAPAWLAYYSRGITPAVNTATAARTITDTAANMASYPNASFPAGTLYIQSDRNVVYRNTGTAWAYLAGTYSAPLASIPALGANDAGFLFGVADYGHLLEWSGAAWGWGPGDSGSGYFQDFAVAPSGAGWHACDGSVIPYLKANGTTGSVTLPNTVATPAYRKLGSTYSAAIAAAAVPLLHMNSYTPAGTNSAPALTMNSYTPAGSVASTFTGTASGSTNVLNTGGSTAVVPAPFTPSGSVASTFTGAAAILTGTVAAPVFTGVAATLTGIISLPADPVANFQAMQYFRQ